MTAEEHRQHDESPASPYNGDEPVWTFRGYKMRPGEFSTAMVHLFRAEISRANVWRQRLDTTTNWAVVTTGAAITIAFSPAGHHAVILLNSLLVTLFLIIEARRYRYYELWSSRVRLMETDFYAAMLAPPFAPAADWAETMAESLLQPRFPISMWEAFGRRYRRNYFAIYLILMLAWLTKVWLLDGGALTFAHLVRSAAIGGVSGQQVLWGTGIYQLILLLIGLLTAGLQQATGEVLPRFEDAFEAVELDDDDDKRPWYRFGRRRNQLMTWIITAQAQVVGQSIMKELRRGVTAIEGTGMYTNSKHTILMCAVTVTEVHHLKAVVQKADENAFVAVAPAQEIFGRGFLPLRNKK